MSWLARFIPERLHVSRRERLLSVLGAALGLWLTEWLSRYWLGSAAPWLIAPMGASTVLLFAAPASPLAQPWSIIGGNCVSAVVGVACALVMGHDGLSAALAVALAIGAMMALRCLHPPGGAVAMTAVLGGPAITGLGFGFALWPVLINSALLLLIALLFNNGLRAGYPHRPPPLEEDHGTLDPKPRERVGFNSADLEAALVAHGELLDIRQEDLAAILTEAERQAYHRRFGELRCADIMSRDVVLAEPGTTLAEAWQRLQHHALKALPVVESGRLVGILSLHDFFKGAALTAAGWLCIPDRGPAETVAERMTLDVHTTWPERPITELIPLFTDGGLHHLPVIDEQRQVLGMITQSDLVAALYRTALERAPAAAEATDRKGRDA